MPQGEFTMKPTVAKPTTHVRSNPNAAAALTFALVNGLHVFSGLSWSYTAAPTGGRLTIAGGGFAFAWDITAAGQGFIPLYEAKSDGTSAIVVTLAAGGAGIVGELNVHGHRIE